MRRIGVLLFCAFAAADSVLAGSLSGRIAWSNGHVNIYNLATGSNVQLPESGVEPMFSPDGTKIAYSSSGIWVMNSDGRNPVMLTNFGGHPQWSPDGSKIAISSGTGIWVINADGSSLHALTSHGRYPAFSPDGTQIAFSSNLISPDYDLWLMNADGSNAHLALTRAGDDIDVDWQPSGQIHFGGDVDQKSGYEIFSFDPATSALVRLTYSAGNDFEPASSPDGSMIAFSSFRKPSGIYVMNADGTNPRLVISGGRQPSWAP